MPRAMQHGFLIVVPLLACLLAISNAKATYQQPTEQGAATTVTVDVHPNNGALQTTIVRSPDASTGEVIAEIKTQSVKARANDDNDDDDDGDADDDEKENDRDRKKSDKPAKGKMPWMNMPSSKAPMPSHVPPQMPGHSPMHMQMPGMQMPGMPGMNIPGMHIPAPSPMHGQNLHHPASESGMHAEGLELLRNINRSLQSIESMMREEKAMEHAERQRDQHFEGPKGPGRMHPMPRMNPTPGRPNPKMQYRQGPRNFKPEFGGPNPRRNNDGPRAQGPRMNGPRDQGPRDQGPRDQGPRDQGPRDQGPRMNGPRDQGPRDQNPRAQGPRDQGPRMDGPRDQGPRAQGPRDQGPPKERPTFQ